MKKFVLLLVLLSTITASGWFYKDSLLPKTSLSPSGSGSGVVFWDRLRATPGYHLVDHYLHSSQCTFAESHGPANFSFPGSFCTILEDGSYIGYSSAQLTLWTPDGALGWRKSLHVHHDLSVNEETKTIFVVSGDFIQEPTDKPPTRLDSIRGYSFEGDELFYWSMKKHQTDFERIVGSKLRRKFNKPFFQFTHVNSVQELPENPVSNAIPAFKAGNILLHEEKFGVIFVVDRSTKKIVWHYYPPDGISAHSVRLNEEGQLVFFSNKKKMSSAGQQYYSAIDFLDIPSKKIVHSIAPLPKDAFFNPYWGSLQLLPGSRFLITNSLGGSAFEMDRSGRILWEWVNPERSPERIQPIYRVRLEPKAKVDKILAVWNPF